MGFEASAMKATEFEYRHQTLVHQCIVGAAFLTYLIDRDDVVWRFVKNSATPHKLERAVFILATLFIAVGAAICTWARAYDGQNSVVGGERYRSRSRYVGELCYAIGLGSLAPLAGFVILLAGEALRVFRLMCLLSGRSMQRLDDHVRSSQQHALPVRSSLARHVELKIHPRWSKAFRQEAVKWGILVTMIVFVITLKDRHAEILAAASFLVGSLLNARVFSRSISHSAG